MSDLKLIYKLSNSPAVLLLGQNYYYEDPNLILADILKKYKLPKSSTYDALFELSAQKEAICEYIAKLSQQLPITTDMEYLSGIRWSAVYTSSVDSFIEKIFETEWRTTIPILTGDENYTDLRNPNKLHISYLYGKAAQIDSNKRPPFNKLEKIKRSTIARKLLAKLGTIITTTGVLVIDGFMPNDWLSTQMLYEYISLLGNEQVFLFSATENLRNDELIVELIKENKLWLSEYSLADFLRINGVISISNATDEFTTNTNNKWIRLGEKRINIPIEIWNAVIRSASVLDENTLVSAPILSKERLKESFRNFLADSSAQPVWSGYAHKFAFERTIYKDLKEKVLQKLRHNTRYEPIILHGQAVSGKTVLLGQLVYQLFLDGYPILYIDRNRKSPDYDDINDFCEWLESKSNTVTTLVVWDGMQAIDNYHKLVRAMQSRGRKVVVVGSAYKENARITKPKSNYIEMSVDLDTTELKALSQLLGNHFGQEVSYKITNLKYSNNPIEKSFDAKNLLALLYRHINTVAPTRQIAEQGIYSEARFVMNSFFDYYLVESKIQENPSMSDWQEQLIKANLVTREEIESKAYQVEQEKYSLPELLIYTVMAVARLGNLGIPLDILIRLFGTQIFRSSLMKAIDKHDLLKWHQDELGNITLSARNEVEAQIILNKNGIDILKQIELYDKLLQSIKIQDTEKNDIELDFVIDLLRSIGSNGTYKIQPNFYYKIATILAKLRENNLRHARLMLQEASLLREIVVYKLKNEAWDLPEGETEIALLNRAESIVQESLDIAKKQIQVFLRVELATIFGYKIKFVNEDKKNDYYEAVKQTVYSTRLQNPDTYHAFDIAVRATENALDSLTKEAKFEARVYFLDLFENAELEGIRDDESELYYANQQKVYNLLGETDLSDTAFKQLCKTGSKAGYYLKAFNKLPVDVTKNPLRQLLTRDNKKNIQDAFNYLEGNRNEIGSDLRCLNLYFKLWWLLNNHKPLFYKADDLLLFDKQQWVFCEKLVNQLISLNGQNEIPANLLFIKGVCEFHLESFTQSKDTFRTLSNKTDYMDTRRVKTWYFASEQQKIKEYSGTVKTDLNVRINQKGQLYCEALRLNINFQLTDFGKSKLSTGEKINFRIAFNFRGLFAQPIK